MSAGEKSAVLAKVASSRLPKRQVLKEIGALKRENGELKQLVAELSLEAYRLKKTAIPMMQDGAGTSG